jgi:hypothetical protein
MFAWRNPLRTPHESFDLTRLASDLRRDMVRRGAFAMNRLVASLAGHQGLTPTRCHPSDPEGLLPPPWFAQVSELADVVNLGVWEQWNRKPA